MIAEWVFSLALLGLSGVANAVPLVPQSQLGYPVDIKGPIQGSGFVLKSDKDELFLVTAKHVLFSTSNVLLTT